MLRIESSPSDTLQMWFSATGPSFISKLRHSFQKIMILVQIHSKHWLEDSFIEFIN